MEHLFSAHSKSVGEAAKQFKADLSRWDVSNVTTMYFMFYKARQFNCNLSSWNVEKVTDMSYMFDGAEQFNCNLSSWNVEKVTIMEGMFDGAKKFDKNTIKGWELKGKETHSMFGVQYEDTKLGEGSRKL